ncbi:MAG: DUF1972 domain-containing protein [Thermaurantimonas sp.]
MARITIVGSRGIPNAYGGFEWLAERLSLHLSAAGHQVYVCQSTQHPYKAPYLGMIQLVRAWDPPIGPAGQLIYDLLSILKVRGLDPDVIIILGYTSSAIWSFLLPKRSSILQHMDGMEWKRAKYSRFAKAFLRQSEKVAARSADILIADHPVIMNYLQNQYPEKATAYIAYGEDDTVPETPLKALETKTFDLIMARLEPENQIDLMIEGWIGAGLPHRLAIAGSLSTAYSRKLVNKYHFAANVVFLNGVFDKGKAIWLRRHCRYYLHGHSAGGTNPSLIQVLTHHRRILVHANPFNAYLAETYGLKMFASAPGLANALKEEPPTNEVSLLTEHRWHEVLKRFDNEIASAIRLKNKHISLQ